MTNNGAKNVRRDTEVTAQDLVMEQQLFEESDDSFSRKKSLQKLEAVRIRSSRDRNRMR